MIMIILTLIFLWLNKPPHRGKVEYHGGGLRVEVAVA
jgi:hypothetical protein